MAVLLNLCNFHSSALNSLLVIDEHLFATGDDSGELKVWDLRKDTSIMEMKEHEEYISDMAIDGNKKLLFTTRYSLLCY